jgi:hypothetical protein
MPHGVLWNHDAEESVIGSVLLAPDRCYPKIPPLRAADFGDPSHAAIWRAIVAVADEGKPIDAVTVGAEIKAADETRKLAHLGGLDYLVDVQSRVVTVENVGVHAQIVLDLATRRRLLEISHRLASAAANDSDAGELIARTRRWLDDLEDESSSATPRSAVRCAADISVTRIDWLWKGRIPAGMISILDGDPGEGKSTISHDLSARVTTGAPMPGETSGNPPGGVVLISYEEHPGAVTVPRLQGAHADLSRVFIWDLAARPFNLRDSQAELRGEIERVGARLVVIDPLMAAMPPDLNSNRDQDVRSVLAGISSIAEQTGCAILLVRHLNKRSGDSALYRGGGSIGIIGAARVGLLLARDPEAENDDAARVLAVTKCNVSRMAPALRQRLVPAPSPAPGVEVARIQWGETAHGSADELVQPSEERSELSRAVELLRELLASGSVAAKDAQEALRANGVSDRTERRAKNKLGVVAERDGIKGPWRWRYAQAAK